MRVNIGVNPVYLADQHLIAESLEITMITGQFKKFNFKLNYVPENFKMGDGHINFFKNKLIYLEKRLFEVNSEMSRRNFNNSTYIDLDLFPKEFVNDYTPTLDDTKIIRNRIVDRLLNPVKNQNPKLYWRYERKVIGENIEQFSNKLLNSELYIV